MEIVLFFISSMLWVFLFPIIAYPYYKKLKKEYNCPNRLFAFAIITALPILATPFVAYVIFLAVWFARAFAAIPLLAFPFCIIYGLFMFYKSFQTKQNKSVRYLVAVWIAIIVIVILFLGILTLYSLLHTPM